MTGDFLTEAVNDLFRSKHAMSGAGLALFLILTLPMAAIVYFGSRYDVQIQRIKKYLGDRPILIFLGFNVAFCRAGSLNLLFRKSRRQLMQFITDKEKANA